MFQADRSLLTPAGQRPHRRSFDETYAGWDEYLTDRVSTSTADRYRCSLAQLAPFLEGKFLDEINGEFGRC